MKKKILSTIFVIVIAAVAVTNIVKNKNSHHTEEVIKDLTLKNMEASAQITEGEGGDNNSRRHIVFHRVRSYVEYKHVGLAQRIMDDIIDLESEKIDKILEKIDSDPEADKI